MKKSVYIIFACLMFILGLGYSYYKYGEVSMITVATSTIGALVAVLVYYLIENKSYKKSSDK
ncbi:hypothetical protein KRX57_07985 [Weeksellaceae bacterium TAE3-ERU29]|nr:hypothetical protein [Weeksellaceae bacterium TAE3-ERU29]